MYRAVTRKTFASTSYSMCLGSEPVFLIIYANKGTEVFTSEEQYLRRYRTAILGKSITIDANHSRNRTGSFPLR